LIATEDTNCCPCKPIFNHL